VPVQQQQLFLYTKSNLILYHGIEKKYQKTLILLLKVGVQKNFQKENVETSIKNSYTL